MKDKPYHHGNLRNQLIEAGITLINEDGLKSFSLRKVAAKCSVSHTAPYSHFKNIDELIYAMGEHVTAQFTDTLRTSIHGKEGTQEAISLLGQAYIDFFVDHPQYFQFLFYHSDITIDLTIIIRIIIRRLLYSAQQPISCLRALACRKKNMRSSWLPYGQWCTEWPHCSPITGSGIPEIGGISLRSNLYFRRITHENDYSRLESATICGIG